MFKRNKILISCLLVLGLLVSLLVVLLTGENRSRVTSEVIDRQHSTESRSELRFMEEEPGTTIIQEFRQNVITPESAISSETSFREVPFDQTKMQNSEAEIELLIKEYHSNLTDPTKRQLLEQQISQLAPRYKEQVLAKVKTLKAQARSQ